MIIGIYGKIGSGKTTFANKFKDNNFLVFNLDYIAKIILEDVNVKKNIFSILPFLNNKNNLNIRKLKKIIFFDIYNNIKFNNIFKVFLLKKLSVLLYKKKWNIIIDGAILSLLNIEVDYLFYINANDKKILKRKKNQYLKSELTNLLMIQNLILQKNIASKVINNNTSKLFINFHYKKMLKFIQMNR